MIFLIGTKIFIKKVICSTRPRYEGYGTVVDYLRDKLIRIIKEEMSLPRIHTLSSFIIWIYE